MTSMDYGFLTDGDDGEHTKGATPFLVKVKLRMMIWSMPLQCKGVDDLAIKETVELLNRLGYPEFIVKSDNEPAMLAFRDALIRELKERFGVRAITQAPPKYDSASAGMVGNAIKHVKEKVRTLVIATRELHGVVMDPEHVALAWCVRFADQINSHVVKRRCTHCTPTCTSACVSPTSHGCSMGRKDLVLGNEQEEDSAHGQVFGRYLLGHQSEEFIVETPAGSVVCRNVKRRPREDAADPVFFNSIRGTPMRLLPDDEPREPREPREQPLRIEVRPVHTDLPPPNSTEPAMPRRVYIGKTQSSRLDMGTPLDTSAVKQP